MKELRGEQSRTCRKEEYVRRVIKQRAATSIARTTSTLEYPKTTSAAVGKTRGTEIMPERNMHSL